MSEVEDAIVAQALRAGVAIKPGDRIRHCVGRKESVEAVVLAVHREGLLLAQAPGEGFAKFVPSNQATLLSEEDEEVS